MFDVDAPSFIGTYQHLHLSPLSNWFLAPSSVCLLYTSDAADE